MVSLVVRDKQMGEPRNTPKIFCRQRSEGNKFGYLDVVVSLTALRWSLPRLCEKIWASFLRVGHTSRILIIKPTRCINFSNLFLE